jgi:putative addiction module antidote
MATTTKIIAIGNSAGIILPKETLARLNVEKGDSVYSPNENPAGLAG